MIERGSKIILAMTIDSWIYEVFKENLGYEVILLKEKIEKKDFNQDKFKFRSIQDRLVNLYRKKVLKDKEYKFTLFKKYQQQDVLRKIKNTPAKSAYSIFIRPDFFGNDIIKLIRRKSKKMVAYQWDGLSRYSEIFDKNDIIKYQEKYMPKFIPLTNCFFDNINFDNNKENRFDVYYLGAMDSRIDQIVFLIQKLQKLELKMNIKITANNEEEYLENKYYPLFSMMKPTKYKDNLADVRKSKIILDFHNPIHNGLSFRPFEALGANKKLITNNQLIKEYDFYNPNNIFVWNENNLDQLEEFINKPYVMIDSEIERKYSFSNWLNYVLDIPPYIKI